MKVFLSWSGERSKRVAEILHKWLPAVIQAVKPYFSPDDVEKGTRWSSEIAVELENSTVGLICLTPENINAPWILFEAGALSKHVGKSRVCAILLGGLKATDVKGPLAQFQSAQFEKADIERVVKMINAALGPDALATEVLKTVFEKWWSELEHEVVEALAAPAPATIPRSDRDLIEEILSLVRSRPTTYDQISRNEIGLLYRLRRQYRPDLGGTMEAQVTVTGPPFSGEILQYHSHLGYLPTAHWQSDSLSEALAGADKEAGGQPRGDWSLGQVRLPG